MLQVYTCNEREKKDFFFLTKMSACFSSVEVCQKRETEKEELRYDQNAGKGECQTKKVESLNNCMCTLQDMFKFKFLSFHLIWLQRAKNA